jgi:hypothetical protein
MDGLFNNREIAIGFWLVVLIVFAACWKVVRTSFVDVLKSAFIPKILIPLVLSFLPTALVVFLLAHFELWDMSVLKETIYWAIGAGLVMFGRFDKVTNVKELYKRTAKDTLKVAIFLEFFIGFYVFPLWIEILFVPSITFIVLLSVVADFQKGKEYELTRKFLKGLTAIVGMVVFLCALIAFIKNPGPLFTYQNLELFLLPIILSFAYTVSVYFVALYSKYELVFNRINHFLRLSVKDKRAVKVAAIRRCGLSVYVTGEIIRHLAINLTNETTKAQALKLVRTFDPKQKSFL